MDWADVAFEGILRNEKRKNEAARIAKKKAQMARRASYRRSYYKTNRVALLAYQHKYHIEHAAKCREYRQSYYRKHRDEVLRRQRERYRAKKGK